MTPPRTHPPLVEEAGRLVDRGPSQPDGHLYLHVPFCRDRCVYCAFPTTPDNGQDHARFVAAILAEASLLVAEHGAEQPLGTVYLGGGTPGLLHASHIGHLLSRIKHLFTLQNDLETTIEVNPANVTRDSLSAWAENGINRISLGVQTLDNSILKRMARRHSGDEATAAMDQLASHWDAGSWSVDLLVGWRDQSGADLQRDLRSVLRHEPPHISVYGLTVEPGTPLWRRRRAGHPVTVSEQQGSELDTLWNEGLRASGYERYEVSNFCRPGARSRHNEAYWQGHEHLGLGPGAASSVGRLRWCNRRDPAAWMAAVETGRALREYVERLGPEERLIELLGSGLRTAEGLSTRGLDRRFSAGWRDRVLPAARALLEQGLLSMGTGRLAVAPGELSRADAILGELMKAWRTPRAA